MSKCQICGHGSDNEILDKAIEVEVESEAKGEAMTDKATSSAVEKMRNKLVTELVKEIVKEDAFMSHIKERARVAGILFKTLEAYHIRRRG